MNLHGYTLELAFPVTIANQVLTRIRALFDESAAQGYPMTSSYRSGINLKFGKAFPDLLSQVTLTDEADWSKGVMMFDFPSYRPDNGIRYNEPFCKFHPSRRYSWARLSLAHRSQSFQNAHQRVPLPPTLDEELARSSSIRQGQLQD
jgi:hypothetical protein